MNGPIRYVTSADAWLDARPRWLLLFGLVATLLILGCADYLTGPDLAFSVFYLLPVSAVAWKYHSRIAFSVALTAAVTWGVADVASGADYSSTLIPVWNTASRWGVFSVVAGLIQTLHGTLEQQSLLANTDSLTGVDNPRSFLGHAEQALEEMRHSQLPLTFAYIDVDDFKKVNDTVGHGGGDDLLRAIGMALVAVTRDSDRVGRLGGDEFALLLPATGSEGARHVMESLQDRVSRSLQVRSDLKVSLSVGAVTFVVPPGGSDDMVNIADNLMYEAKGAGKATWRHTTIGSETEGAMKDRSAPRPIHG
ncbi:MAG TPA: GGDEF domain-containing protein [Actinomycetota bacterium]|nr:GGDEF domain-containing protein [Actinomycetota bacterium]